MLRQNLPNARKSFLTYLQLLLNSLQSHLEMREMFAKIYTAMWHFTQTAPVLQIDNIGPRNAIQYKQH